MKNIRRSLMGALLVGPALLLLACGGDYGTDPQQQRFMGCSVRQIYLDESRAGTLSSADCIVEGAYAEMYYLEINGDRDAIIDLESFDFDAYLVLYDWDTGEVLAENDDLNSVDSDARLSGFLPQGRYAISATTYDPGETGRYVLTVD